MSFGMPLEVQRDSGHPSKVQVASTDLPSLTPWGSLILWDHVTLLGADFQKMDIAGVYNTEVFSSLPIHILRG